MFYLTVYTTAFNSRVWNAWTAVCSVHTPETAWREHCAVPQCLTQAVQPTTLLTALEITMRTAIACLCTAGPQSGSNLHTPHKLHSPEQQGTSARV